jgi:hypothetical protein
VVGGHLPAGLSLQEASTQEAWVLGTPATAGTSTLTAQVTDNAGTTARQSFTITDVTVTFILLNAAGQQVGGPAGCAPPATELQQHVHPQLEPQPDPGRGDEQPRRVRDRAPVRLPTLAAGTAAEPGRAGA